jgi:HK97 family phage major capsid protein
MEIKDLVEQLNTANTELKNMRDKLTAEVKATGDATAETKAAIEAQETKYTDLVGKFGKLDEKLIEMEKEAKRFRSSQSVESKSMGAQFVSSDVFGELKNGQGFNRRVEIKSITGVAASAGGLIDNYRDPEVYRSIGGRRQLRVRDLLPQIPVDSGSVEIMRQNSFTNNAAPQQPASANSAAGAGELQTKAQSNITWELVTVPVRTMAHWVPASRQVLSDAPQLQGLIDTELTYGLQLLSDAQILNGAGTNQSLTGILNDAAINDVGEIASGTSAADLPAAMIDHIRAAITLCQQAEYYNINGLVINPADWQVLETAKATDGHYLLVAFAASSAETPSVWRVPVIVSNAIAADTFLLGDWTMGAKLYVREGVSVRVSESHADLFVQNGVAILAEERMALGVNAPKAFATGSFAVASGD